MHTLLLLVLPLFAAAQAPQNQNPANQPGAAQQKRPEKCSIAGQVTNLATGAPVNKANLILRRADPQAGSMMMQIYSTATGPDGKFAMADLEPGRYRLMVNRTGFVSTEYGSRGPMRAGTILALAPGQQFKDVNFRLTPHAVVAGRVVDEDGEPVAYVRVQAMRYRYFQGRKQLLPVGGGSTNDLGEYRIFGLPPGRIYLSATYRAGGMYEPSIDRSSNSAPEEGYVPVYYPNTTDRAGAAPLDIAAGSQTRAVDFILSKARTVRVRGRVVDTTGGSERAIQLMLMPRTGIAFMESNRTTVKDKEGHFEFSGVAPGSYYLAGLVFEENKPYSARQAVDVGSSNVDDVLLTLNKGTEIQGSVRIEGGDPSAKLGDLRITLRPRETSTPFFGSAGGRVKEDGTFTLTDVTPESYLVSSFGLPDGYYMKSIRMGDTDVKEDGLDMEKGAAGPLEVVVSPRAAAVEGVVRNEDQNPAPGVTVVLVPPARLRDRMDAYKNTTTDQYGRFTLKNLEPGDYTLLAWEDIEPGAYMDPDVLKPVESSGKSISLQEGAHESVDLKMIPAPDEGMPKPATSSAP